MMTSTITKSNLIFTVMLRACNVIECVGVLLVITALGSINLVRVQKNLGNFQTCCPHVVGCNLLHHHPSFQIPRVCAR